MQVPGELWEQTQVRDGKSSLKLRPQIWCQQTCAVIYFKSLKVIQAFFTLIVRNKGTPGQGTAQWQSPHNTQ